MDILENKINKDEEIKIIDFPPMPIEDDYIICYIDVLGSKDLISKGEFFETLYDAFSFALNVESKLKIFGDLTFKVFSDNILMAHKIPNDNNYGWYVAYKNIVDFLKSFLSRFLCSGILIRGGITIGKLAINEVMVWGSGLVEAVKLEENNAVYPKIIISKRLADMLYNYPLTKDEIFDEKFSCFCDTDGSLFIDYIHYSEMPTAETSLRYSHEITCQKIKHEKDQKVLQKLQWHLNYLERAKDIFNEYYSDFNRLEWENNEEDEG